MRAVPTRVHADYRQRFCRVKQRTECGHEVTFDCAQDNFSAREHAERQLVKRTRGGVPHTLDQRVFLPEQRSKRFARARKPSRVLDIKVLHEQIGDNEHHFGRRCQFVFFPAKKNPPKDKKMAAALVVAELANPDATSLQDVLTTLQKLDLSPPLALQTAGSLEHARATLREHDVPDDVQRRMLAMLYPFAKYLPGSKIVIECGRWGSVLGTPGDDSRDGKPKQCFNNVFSMDSSNMMFGVVALEAAGFFPVPHAWLRRPDGSVHEVTLPKSETAYYLGVHVPALTYVHVYERNPLGTTDFFDGLRFLPQSEQREIVDELCRGNAL